MIVLFVVQVARNAVVVAASCTSCCPSDHLLVRDVLDTRLLLLAGVLPSSMLAVQQISEALKQDGMKQRMAGGIGWCHVVSHAWHMLRPGMQLLHSCEAAAVLQPSPVALLRFWAVASQLSWDVQNGQQCVQRALLAAHMSNFVLLTCCAPGLGEAGARQLARSAAGVSRGY
jgi:hypothetical protein